MKQISKLTSEVLDKLNKKQLFKLADLMDIGYSENDYEDKGELIVVLKIESESKILRALKQLHL
jgi:hypothetical protein